MNQQSMLRDVIIRDKRPSYEFRERERMHCAAIALASTAVIGLVAFGCMIVRGCHPAPAVADCICEECGHIIADSDHGRCHAMEVASNKAIRQ